MTVGFPPMIARAIYDALDAHPCRTEALDIAVVPRDRDALLVLWLANVPAGTPRSVVAVVSEAMSVDREPDAPRPPEGAP